MRTRHELRRIRPGAAGLAVSLAASALLASPSAASVLPTTGTETFVGTQIGATATGRVYAVGPITAIGTDEVVSDTEDVWHFPAGDLTLQHVPAREQQSFDPTTCTFRLTESGTVDIVSGTGAYAGARWHGNYQVQILSVGCTDPPRTFVFVIRAQGPVTLAG